MGQRRLHRVLGTLEETALEIVPVGRELTLAAAHVKAEHPLAHADAFAAALTSHTEATLVTGDPEFRLLEDNLMHSLATLERVGHGGASLYSYSTLSHTNTRDAGPRPRPTRGAMDAQSDLAELEEDCLVNT